MRKSKHFVFSIFFFENDVLYDKMLKKGGRAGQATDKNNAHAHCMQDA
jgi:hypothetical protein